MPTEPIRYLLDNDDDGHWYLVPELVHPMFEAWVEGDNESIPDGAVSLGSHPNAVTFEAPQHFGKPIAAGSTDQPSNYVCDGCGGQAEVWVDGRPLCRREPEAEAQP